MVGVQVELSRAEQRLHELIARGSTRALGDALTLLIAHVCRCRRPVKLTTPRAGRPAGAYCNAPPMNRLRTRTTSRHQR